MKDVTTDATKPSGATTPTVREVPRLVWEAYRYPRLGNADARDAEFLEREALSKASLAKPLHDDPPEFAVWIDRLRERYLAGDERQAIYDAIADYFEPHHAVTEIAENGR
jgi:hypothetical protein